MDEVPPLVGATLVLYRPPQHRELERMRWRAVGRSAVTAQSVFRQCFARTVFIQLREGKVLLDNAMHSKDQTMLQDALVHCDAMLRPLPLRFTKKARAVEEALRRREEYVEEHLILYSSVWRDSYSTRHFYTET